MSELGPETRARIEALVTQSRVVLFMKGTPMFPQCGFSATVVTILKQHGAKYETVNVLTEPEIREGIKAYSGWPTIPQLYVDGKLVGGADIARELHLSGELATLLGSAASAGAAKPAPGKLPTLRVSDGAARALREACADADGDRLRLGIDPSFAYDLSFGPREPGDVEVVSSGVAFLLDPESASRADELSIDFVDGPSGGFKLESPHEPPRVRELSARELDARRRSGEIAHLFDVRTPEERALASIEGGVLLDDAGEARLRALPKDTPIAFHCHHGIRSRNAAQRFLRDGYTRLYNLSGGIAAWSRDVDPKVPMY